MSERTLAGAKADVVAELVAAKATFGGADVFPYQPQIAEVESGLGVCVFTAGVTPEFWQIGVRILITATVSQQQAQDDMDVYVLAVDAALPSQFGPSNWVPEFPTIEAPYYSMTNVLQVGREDF